jgi:hypothetical protein
LASPSLYFFASCFIYNVDLFSSLWVFALAARLRERELFRVGKGHRQKKIPTAATAFWSCSRTAFRAGTKVKANNNSLVLTRARRAVAFCGHHCRRPSPASRYRTRAVGGRCQPETPLRELNRPSICFCQEQGHHTRKRRARERRDTVAGMNSSVTESSVLRSSSPGPQFMHSPSATFRFAASPATKRSMPHDAALVSDGPSPPLRSPSGVSRALSAPLGFRTHQVRTLSVAMQALSRLAASPSLAILSLSAPASAVSLDRKQNQLSLSLRGKNSKQTWDCFFDGGVQ